MSEDSPKVVRLDTSLELSEFFSEAEPPSDSAFPSEAEAAAPVVPVPQEVPAAAREVVASDEGITTVPAAASPHIGPATVTEFPVRPQVPPAIALPSLPPGPVTLVELIERRGGFDWREAVAVIHQICLYLRDRSPHAPILLDPRNIQITDKGEVQLLSGQTSSDPLVIQVGRLLRTMLMGKEAPPELRLLLAQATFELPIFESIEDVDRALAQLNKLDEPGPAGVALLRAVTAPPPPNHDDIAGNRPPSIRSILPAYRVAPRQSRKRRQLQSLVETYASHVAVSFAVIAVIGAVLLTRPAVLFPSDAPPATRPPIAPIAIAPSGPAPADRSPSQPAAAEPTGALGAPPAIRQPPSSARPSSSNAATPLEGRDNRHGPELTPTGPAATAGVVLTPPATLKPRASRATPAPVSAPPAPPAPSPRDSERRATELLRQGQTAEASMAFDALVMSNPLYEPTNLTPEGLAAFRTSQRQLLPAIVQRNYDRAIAALAAGDPDRALALGKETAALLDRRLADTPAQLRQQVADLIEQASTAAAAANEVIYTEADAGVIPPRPLSRQMPLTGPIGIPPHRVGWLEMVISRDGGVYYVKLHTPLNRHHERMIVSAAKAWRYRPAMKSGKPVMYRIHVKINLPESG